MDLATVYGIRSSLASKEFHRYCCGMVSMDLGVIAAQLEGLEETIIHRLIDRAQFRQNPAAYQTGASGFSDGSGKSLFELRLRHQEEMDSLFGRYQVPEERPFHADLPLPRRKSIQPESPLAASAAQAVNCTTELTQLYLAFVPALCEPGDDGQHGSTVEHDVLAIQAIGRRVHYGALYVAESKYRSTPENFTAAVAAAAEGELSALTELITREEVERRILHRVSAKVDYIQASLNADVRRRIDPQTVLTLYRDIVIPMTKKGEIDYLMVRADPGAETGVRSQAGE